jgi:hypothetical protein
MVPTDWLPHCINCPEGHLSSLVLLLLLLLSLKLSLYLLFLFFFRFLVLHCLLRPNEWQPFIHLQSACSLCQTSHLGIAFWYKASFQTGGPRWHSSLTWCGTLSLQGSHYGGGKNCWFFAGGFWICLDYLWLFNSRCIYRPCCIVRWARAQ